tara:strand:- start:557 stop:751 length:195 start_codon:yes stop_codon:yes gene_type:complete
MPRALLPQAMSGFIGIVARREGSWLALYGTLWRTLSRYSQVEALKDVKKGVGELLFYVTPIVRQ